MRVLYQSGTCGGGTACRSAALTGASCQALLMQTVAVAGGGISGLCAAYYLRQAGAEVTILESRRVGSGASSGNAGWVTPAQAGPLPEPGLISYGVRSLVDRRSALYFEPGRLVRMLPWLLRFARRCNQRDHERGRLALARLGRRSFELLDRMVDDGVAIEVRRTPLLIAAERAEHAERFRVGLQPIADLGFAVPSAVLDGAALRRVEPVLADSVRAGFVIEQHRHVDPQQLLTALRTRLLEMGAQIVEGSEVVDIEGDGRRLAALRTSTGRYRCDAAVLAPGAWLGALGRVFGIRLPVQAGKGYRFELRPRRMPRHALLLLEPHVGCSPIGERLRIAGTMEFSGINGRLDRRRIDAIVEGARRMIDGWTGLDEDTLWSGLRPIAPDGLPIVDRHPRLQNVFVAGAYSMLGMTLAAPAAESLAEFVLTGSRPAELAPFGCGRFGLRDSLRAVP
jgi:D-amino-acid dehydrogenase